MIHSWQGRNYIFWNLESVWQKPQPDQGAGYSNLGRGEYIVKAEKLDIMENSRYDMALEFTFKIWHEKQTDTYNSRERGPVSGEKTKREFETTLITIHLWIIDNKQYSLEILPQRSTYNLR